VARIFDILTAFVLCIYFMLEGDHAYQWFMSLFSVETACASPSRWRRPRSA